MGLFPGRPAIDVILERQNASARARFIAQEIQRASPLMQILEFDDSTVPNARARRITFPYTRRNTARVAQLRNWYTDYAPQFIRGETNAEAVLRPIGDAFEIDRVFGDADPDYVQENITGMAPGIASLFADLAINGDNAADGREFNGLSKILDGTPQEINGSGMNFAMGQTDGNLREYVGAIRRQIMAMRALGLQPVVLGNADLSHRLAMAGEQLGYVTTGPDQFGVNQIVSIAGAPIVDAGMTNTLSGTNVVGSEIIPTTAGGLTDLYILGVSRQNGFTGLTLAGGQGRPEPIQYRTASTDSGVLRRFEAEIVGGVALLDERAAVVYRDIRVNPAP